MDQETKEFIKKKLSLVPELPGSYQMKDKDGVIIYVGKAKNLHRRVSSYFTRTVTGKTAMLVADIKDFDYIVTSSELESLILEITLIKKYDPKYNILLRDDKTYPYIELTTEKYPRVRVIRNVNRKKKTTHMFGPYPNVTSARQTVEIINRIYPLRKCETLQKDVCLYYHLGECLGYCKKNIDPAEIKQMTSEITSFLKGDASIVTNKLKAEMEQASASLNFEKALELKNMLDSIHVTLRHQKIDLNRKYNFDLLSFYSDNGLVAVECFFIREGLLFGQHHDLFSLVSTPEEDVTEYFIKFYAKSSMSPKMLVVDSKLDQKLLSDYFGVKVSSPSRGNIKKLIDLARENAKINLKNKEEEIKKSDSSRYRAIASLKKILHTDKVSRIESFDNSHLFGTFYVAGMVTFVDFLPHRNDYRKFRISSSVKDDLGAMREVLYRRYYHVMMEEEKGPDLIVLDGGETQVSVANEVLASLNLKIPVIGLKKNDKHRTESLVLQDLTEIPIKEHPDLFVYLGRIQEEVHRFAITYHRNIKSKGTLSSLLDMAPGIGKVRKKQLLRKFGSLKKMKEASLEELEEVLGPTLAVQFQEFLSHQLETQERREENE